MSYSFPLLKGVDISACLTELGMPLSVAQLHAPTEEDLRPVFEKMLELLKGVSREELRTLDFRAMGALSNPELHEESMVEMGSLKELLDLARKTGVSDATLSDFVQPQKDRVRRILSALINFAKFREDKLEHFSQFTAQSQTLLELRASEEAAADELERTRAQLAATHEQEAPLALSVQADVEAKQAQLNALVTEQTALREEMRAAKAISAELATACTERATEIATIQNENTKLRSQIIAEPEKLKAALKDMTNSMQAGRGDLAQQNAKFKQQQTRNTQLAKAEEKLQKRVELIKSFKTEQAALARLRKVVAERTHEETALIEAVSELESQEATLRSNLSASQEKLFSLQQSFETKRVTALSALETVRGEKAQLEAKLAAARAQQDANEQAMTLKNQQLANAQQEHQRTVHSLRSKYQTLQQAVGEYHVQLTEVMNQAAATVV